MLRRIIVFLAVISLTLSFQIYPVDAEVIHEHGFMKFEGAYADFSYKDGCIVTLSTIDIQKGIYFWYEGPADKLVYYYITIGVIDTCTRVWALWADAELTYQESEVDLVVKNDLAEASLKNLTVQVHDYISDSDFPVTINLDWVGSGDITNDNPHSVYPPPINDNDLSTYFYHLSERPAVASGTIVGKGINFSPNTTTWYTGIYEYKGGSNTVDKP